MKYFIRAGLIEKGPYTLDELRESVVDGLLSADTEARREDGDDWRTVRRHLLAAAPKKKRRKRKRSSRAAADEELVISPYAPPRDWDRDEDDEWEGDDDDLPVDRGSFMLGFVAGMLGGCIALVIIARKGKPDTKRGVWAGFATQAVLGLMMRAAGI